jgi:hypothetical protein
LPEDPETFCELEFPADDGLGLDTRVSVYEIAGADRVIQAHAEHYARSNLGRQGKHNLDLSDLTPAPQGAPLVNGFAFTAAAHREIPFQTEGAVREMAAVLHAQLATRQYPVSKAQLREYARGRRDAGDAEWLAFYAGSPAATDW